MKRFKIIKILAQNMKKDDLGVFIGQGICNEVSAYRYDTDIYLDDRDDCLLSFALGIAMCTKKRVFVFCDNQYFIRNLSEFMQASVSKCKNFFLILFVNEYYEEVDNTYIISNNVNIDGVFYSLGMMTYNYTNLMNNDKSPSKIIEKYWAWLKGPSVILIQVDKGTKNLSNREFFSKDNLEDVKNFLRTE